ncbi:acetyltransferase-like isoleucine patch superfamily enzyme [Lentzea atacamensis]|uniref:Acetyltransferase-like isoleucine patch superfamily enzyme n=2 Tax=Lentzea atacamensis TaxID=531938 RepID=A0A316IAT1_9PSEU|nr:acetyltransferase-like isoleucine patch superfamily enzyme [Lentzea atacamensis]RAS60644.1 acetyltransferase-like isoleucine patch superfamily enzyme [Lentzea atacamensis]
MKNALLRALGHRVHPSAHLGICLVVNTGEIAVGEAAFVGHGNVFRRLRALRIGEDAVIGQLNWFSIAPSLTPAKDGLGGMLRLDDHAVITNRHYVDCSGGVWLARFASLVGVRSTVLTHSLDLRAGKQTTASVVLAEHAFVGTSSTIMPGTRMASRAVLAAGGVTALGGRYEPNTLYGGVPAKPIKNIDGAYFHRARAWVVQ